MFENVIDQLTKEMGKKKDEWFLETMKKHKLIKSSDVSNFDIYWLKEEMGVKVVNTHDNKTQIYIENRYVGEWDNNYQLVKTSDNKFEVKTDYWN